MWIWTSGSLTIPVLFCFVISDPDCPALQNSPNGLLQNIFLLDNAMTQEEAMARCEDCDATLIVPENRDERRDLARFVMNEISRGCVWIGFVRERE